jgi:hypothetical protein
MNNFYRKICMIINNKFVYPANIALNLSRNLYFFHKNNMLYAGADFALVIKIN